ncbi:regulator of G-protein signaling 9a isoform X2 [Brachyhypopomus gauderio]|uniref:regulator of G-protein signaling 9a isoform X2 n=1 Tax=Brachyhypopomus gauderio TaxID=698409 RepID=UPI00404392EC
MTIKLIRDHGQHYRPRMACLKKVEALLIEMQDPKSGVNSSEQKLSVTSIPHVIAGKDIIAWITSHMKVDTQEAQAVGTMLVAFGFIYPLQDPKKLILKADGSFYRFQTPYFWPAQKWKAQDTDYAIYLAKRNIRKKGILDEYEQERYEKFYKWLNHKWDFIVNQAKEQNRAGKQRTKADRVVFDCQERAYWIVHRPPPETHSAMDYGVDRLFDPNAEEEKTSYYYRRIIIFTQQAIMRPKVKSTVSLGANPWQTDDDAYWTLNMPEVCQPEPAERNKQKAQGKQDGVVWSTVPQPSPRGPPDSTRSAPSPHLLQCSELFEPCIVDLPTKMTVERWSFSFLELLRDPCGRANFRLFLKKEFSGENLAFWEAAEELKWGAASAISEKAETVFKMFLAPGAPRWINVDGRTMALTVKGLQCPHRYVLDAAQTHIFMLMKKDTFYRYLKSPVYKDMQKKAISPAPHNFTEAQLEQNSRNRKPGLHPFVTWQRQQEEKARAAAATAPIDIKKLIANKLERQ